MSSCFKMHWASIENHEQELTKGKRPPWITMVSQGQKKVERVWVERGQRRSSNKWRKQLNSQVGLNYIKWTIIANEKKTTTKLKPQRKLKEMRKNKRHMSMKNHQQQNWKLREEKGERRHVSMKHLQQQNLERRKGIAIVNRKIGQRQLRKEGKGTNHHC